MGKVIAGIFMTIVTSFYLFPLDIKFIPGTNTKMILAVIGLVILLFSRVGARDGLLDKGFLKLSALAAVVSLFSFAAVCVNDTNDYTYVSYVVSMWVWAGGAYAVVRLIKAIHGTFTIEYLAGYLAAVGVGQCLSALMIDNYPAVRQFALSILGDMSFIDDRLFGFGAALDPAGIRFSAILIIIAYVCRTSTRISRAGLAMLIVSFLIITMVGNVMSRTTTVGAIIGIAFWVWSSLHDRESRLRSARFWQIVIVPLIVGVAVGVWLYNTNEQFHDYLRFGFEGFFSLAEQGRWEVHSNDVLRSMWVLPDTPHTWLIGDGYIIDPYGTDPYYTGPDWDGSYYKNTDIGYLRFIFYFGIFGLAAFCAFFLYVGKYCIARATNYRLLLVMLVGLNFIVWFKVATDLFCILALFIAAGAVAGTEKETKNTAGVSAEADVAASEQ